MKTICFVLLPFCLTLAVSYADGQREQTGQSDLVLTRLRVPQDYPTVQAAIDAAHHGDTVLVSEGTYYENIRYRGKAITVGSLYVIDGDTTHIAKTIIDGSKSAQPDSGSVVYFINGEDTTSVLCGFTITGGTGTPYNPYGHTFGNRYGGGVFCDSAGARVTRNIITRNRVVAEVAGGAGIVASTISVTFVPVVILEANQIKDNYVENSYPYNYYCSGGGANLNGVECRVTGNVFERDTVVGAFGAQGGGLIVWCDPRGGSYAFPHEIVVENIFRSNVVRASGEGGDGGGLAVKFTGQVTIRDNLFQSNTATSMGTSGFSFGGGLYVYDDEIAADRRKAILNNRFLGNTVLCYNKNRGGGLDLYHTLATVSGNEFTANTVGRFSATGGGGGISTENSSFHIENNIITGNFSACWGGGLSIAGASPVGTEQVLINNTVFGNSSLRGGGISVTAGASGVLFNNIFWDNSATAGSPEIYVSGATANVRYCDVKGGYAGIGNINADPAFVTGDTLLHLTAMSPCVESGVGSVAVGGVSFDAPMSDFGGMLRPMPAGTPPDIGAQEEQTTAIACVHCPALDCRYAKPGVGCVCVTTVLVNPLHHSTAVSAIVTDALGTVRDSLPFFNDGLHGDGSAGDSIWGCRILGPSGEGYFSISVRTDDFTQGTVRRFPGAFPFTTAGPIVHVGDTSNASPHWGSSFLFLLYLANEGSVLTIPAVTAAVVSLDTLATVLAPNLVPAGSIAPNDTNRTTSVRIFFYPTGTGVRDLPFELIFYTLGVEYWRDTMTIRVTPAGAVAADKAVPTTFALGQNYPNPFNPVTSIEYRISNTEHVVLKVFDILGREVAVLVNEKQVPGRYEVKFDGSGLSSGVYFYRLTAGKFVETRKMVLVQ